MNQLVVYPNSGLAPFGSISEVLVGNAEYKAIEDNCDYDRNNNCNPDFNIRPDPGAPLLFLHLGFKGVPFLLLQYLFHKHSDQ